ncbi:MAG: hypothetical protein E6I87_14705 [Chloroflexi bacterium]|nr:MAG: hypothetical protein E6I87_14705 [Chloroflexota bacterium]
MAKVLISLDTRLLRRIDAAARRLGLTRSRYFARLARRDLGVVEGPGRDPRVRAALRTLDRLFAENPTSGDPATIIRRMRDERGAKIARQVGQGR